MTSFTVKFTSRVHQCSASVLWGCEFFCDFKSFLLCHCFRMCFLWSDVIRRPSSLMPKNRPPFMNWSASWRAFWRGRLKSRSFTRYDWIYLRQALPLAWRTSQYWSYLSVEAPSLLKCYEVELTAEILFEVFNSIHGFKKSIFFSDRL